MAGKYHPDWEFNNSANQLSPRLARVPAGNGLALGAIHSGDFADCGSCVGREPVQGGRKWGAAGFKFCVCRRAACILAGAASDPHDGVAPAAIHLQPLRRPSQRMSACYFANYGFSNFNSMSQAQCAGHTDCTWCLSRFRFGNSLSAHVSLVVAAVLKSWVIDEVGRGFPIGRMRLSIIVMFQLLFWSALCASS